MEKYFKYIVALIIGVFAVSIFVMQIIPDEKERLIKRLNEDLPRDIGTVGIWESVTYENKSITYNLRVKNSGQETDSLYRIHYYDFRECMMYAVIKMNGQRDKGTLISNLLSYYKEKMTVRVFLANDKSYSWTFTGDELLSFIYRVRLTPTEAFQKIIDMHIMMANISLPAILDDNEGFQSIPVNSIRNIAGEKDILLAIKHDSTSIIYEFLTPEVDYSLDDIGGISENEEALMLFAEEMSKDLDIQESMNQLVLTHADLKITYTSTKQEKTITITIPYRILKQYCSLPEDIIKNLIS